MRMDDEDNENGYQESGRHGAGFSSALISDDGRFFGIKLPKDMASNLRGFYATGVDWLRRKGEQIGVPMVESVAKFFGANEQRAMHIGGKAGDYIGYGIILSEQLFDIGRNIYDSTKSLNNLRLAVRPLAKSGSVTSSVSPLSGDNEVVANARAKINGVFWQRLLKTATGTIAIAPALMFKMNDQKEKNSKRKDQFAIERAGNNPEQIADIMEHDITVGSAKHLGGNVASIREARNIVVDRHRARYEGEHADFVKKGMDGARREIRTLLEEITADNFQHHARALRQKGLPIDELHNTINNRAHRGQGNNPADHVEHFKQEGLRHLDHYATELLTAKFVKQKGAFDREWTNYLHHGEERDSYGYGYGHRGERETTIREELEAQINDRYRSQKQEQDEDRSGHSRGHKSQESEMGKMAAGLAAGVTSEVITQKFFSKMLGKYGQPIALDRILHLRDVLEQAQDNPPEQVPGIVSGKRSERDSSYARYVHDIFQQHQRDCHRAAIGDRFFEHFNAARWDDAAIQQLPDDELTTYEYAVKMIAKRIKDKRMDVTSLIGLVGDKQKKLVRDDGRSFGPRGAGKNDEDIKKAIHRLVDEQTMAVHSGQTQTDDQISQTLGNFVFSVDDMKRALQAQGGDPQERAFLFTLFSELVGSDEKLCQMLGISDKRCHELRGEMKESFHAMLDAAACIVADVVKSNPQLLKELKLSDQQQELLLSLAEKIQDTGKNLADLVEGREDVKALETIVINAVMSLKKAEHNTGQPKVWTQIAQKAKAIPEMIAERKQRRRNEGDLSDVSLDHHGVKPSTRRKAAMKENDDTSPLDDRMMGGMEDEMPALSAQERELKRRRSADPSEEMAAGRN